jgi:oligoribonuclease
MKSKPIIGIPAAAQNKEAMKEVIKDALVWIDCEMTGLGAEGGPGNDVLLEVACLITDGDLNLIAEGPDLIIHQPDETLAGMNDWCKKQFGWKGMGDVEQGLLADQVRRSTVTLGEADRQLTDFVKQYVEKGGGVLTGNTVHMDKRFLDKFTPSLMSHLHYRLVDVSTLKELCRRWYPDVYAEAPKKRNVHRALDDIKESLEELKFYRKALVMTKVA